MVIYKLKGFMGSIMVGAHYALIYSLLTCHPDGFAMSKRTEHANDF